MKKIKVLISVMMCFSAVNMNVIFAQTTEEDIDPNETVIDETSGEKNDDNSVEQYVEEDVEQYFYDESGNIVGNVEDEIDESSPKSRAAVTYSLGYLDFFGVGSKVINVYPSATSNSAYTYFNSGSGERVATLSESNGRVKIVINGYTGYVNKTDVSNATWYKISQIGSGYSEYYTVNASGDLLYTYGYYETVTTIVTGKAPSFLSTGVKYFSLDGVYFYNNRTTMFNNFNSGVVSNSLNPSNPYYNYYQYLPFRSKTNLTNTDFKNFLTSKLSGSNLSTSVLNNDAAIKQFFTSQDELATNAALEFSMAMLESGYGTSQIAREKNNLFGWGAVDSGPYAGAFKFSSVSQGVAYHFENAISSGYLDAADDSRYYGGNVGNKNNGVNVKYASDPYWGMKIAGLYYSMDKSAGFKDYNYYKIAIQKDVGSYAYINGKFSYVAKNNVSNFYVTNMPYLVVGTDSTFLTVISDVPVCNTGDKIEHLTINQSTLSLVRQKYSCNSSGVHFAADVSYSKDTVQMAKSRFVFTGSSDIKKPGGDAGILSDVTYVYKNNSNVIDYAYKNNDKGEIIEYYTFKDNTTLNTANANLNHVFVMNPSSATIEYSYDKNGGLIPQYYEYHSGTKFGEHASNRKFVFRMNTSTKYITDAYRVNSDQKIDRYYQYYSKTEYGKHANKIRFVFDVDANTNYLKGAYALNESSQITVRYEYKKNTVYGNHGSMIRYIFNIVPSTQEIKDAYSMNENRQIYVRYVYNTGTKYDSTNASHGKNIKTVFNINASTQNIKNSYDKNSDNLIVKRNEYSPGTKYDENKYTHNSKVRYDFIIDPSTQNIVYAIGNNSDQRVIRYFEYISGTKYDENKGSHGGKFSHVYVIDPKTKYIVVSHSYKNGKPDYEYMYKRNTTYGLHTNAIVSKKKV